MNSSELEVTEGSADEAWNLGMIMLGLQEEAEYVRTIRGETVKGEFPWVAHKLDSAKCNDLESRSVGLNEYELAVLIYASDVGVITMRQRLRMMVGDQIKELAKQIESGEFTV